MNALTKKVEGKKVKQFPSLVFVGAKLIYSDASNFCRWTVTEIFDGGFLAKDDYEEKDFWFDTMQDHWEFARQ